MQNFCKETYSSNTYDSGYTSKGKNNASATFELKGTVITRRMMHCSSVAFNLDRYFAVPCGAVILVFLVPHSADGKCH